MVVVFSSNVFVLWSVTLIWGVEGQGLLIEVVLQDGFDALIREGFDGQCSG